MVSENRQTARGQTALRTTAREVKYDHTCPGCGGHVVITYGSTDGIHFQAQRIESGNSEAVKPRSE